MTSITDNEYLDKIKTRILALSDWAWGGYPSWPDVDNWLQNFKGSTGYTKEQEKIHALFILSEFLFFGNKQIRTLLQALYRDHFLIPMIEKIRNNNANTRNLEDISQLFKKELELTKFLGIGNPSESGAHLLYYFRQENDLQKTNFEEVGNLLKIEKDANGNEKKVLSDQNIVRYVFIDDICGTGDTAIKYSNDILSEIRNIDNRIEFHYLTLFATNIGLKEVKQNTVFGENCKTIFELDSTYQLLSETSRYFRNQPKLIDKKVTSEIVRYYGSLLWKDCPCGYGNCQLILGMGHNIPNSTIPIIWYENDAIVWVPIFKRYAKGKF